MHSHPTSNDDDDADDDDDDDDDEDDEDDEDEGDVGDVQQQELEQQQERSALQQQQEATHAEELAAGTLRSFNSDNLQVRKRNEEEEGDGDSPLPPPYGAIRDTAAQVLQDDAGLRDQLAKQTVTIRRLGDAVSEQLGVSGGFEQLHREDSGCAAVSGGAASVVPADVPATKKEAQTLLKTSLLNAHKVLLARQQQEEARDPAEFAAVSSGRRSDGTVVAHQSALQVRHEPILRMILRVTYRVPTLSLQHWLRPCAPLRPGAPLGASFVCINRPT